MIDNIPEYENDDGRCAHVTIQYALITVLVAAAVIGIVRFERFCISDLGQTSDAELLVLSRAGWLAVILLLIPIGGIAYLYCGKMR